MGPNPLEINAGQSVGYKSEEGPTVFSCKDFPRTECCECCHQNNFVIAVYPWSVYSRGRERMPDLGLGLRAEVCCGLFNYVRLLPREWWIRKYAEKKRWTEQDADRLVAATPETYYKVWGQIADLRHTGPRVARVASKTTRGAAQRVSVRPSKCPSCGGSWDYIVCSNCGHSA